MKVIYIYKKTIFYIYYFYELFCNIFKVPTIIYDFLSHCNTYYLRKILIIPWTLK